MRRGILILIFGLILINFNYGQYINQTGTPYAGNIYHLNYNLGLGTTTPSYILSFGNNQNQKIWIENTASGTDGRALTIAAGGTVSGGTNKVGGNLILSSGSGTGTGASAISFYTGTPQGTATNLQNLSEKMRILGNGYVGIGTTTPSSLLHIEGNYSDGTDNLVPQMKVINAATDKGYAFIKAMMGNGYAGGYAEIWIQAMKDNFGVSTVGIRGVSNHDMNFYTNNSVRMTLTKDGKLGIGTLSPSQKLQIDHNDASGGIVLNQLSGTTYKSEIRFNHSGTELWAIGNDFNEDNNQNFFIWDHAATSARFLINQNGNVGIGTTTPGAKLEVNSGTANGLVVTTQQTTQYGYCIQAIVSNNYTKAFSVTGNGTENFIVYGSGYVWARDIHVKAGTPFGDFIFDKNYDLFSISELEKFINKNHHLPGIPSAAEVEEKGINVGDFQNLLLQKIEEQALYIINLQKQIDELKEQMNASRKN